MIVRRVVSVVRNNGIIGLMFRLLGHVAYRRLLLLESDLTGRTFPVDPRCRWLLASEAEAYAQFDPTLSITEVRRRLAGGQRCWVLMLPDRTIAHGFWVATSTVRVDYLEIDLEIAGGEAYLYQSFTPPAHRGRGYASRAIAAAKAQLAASGVRRTLSCILPDNRLAYPPVFANGPAPVAYIGWYGLGTWRRPFRRVAHRFPWYAPSPSSSGAAAR